MHLSTALRTPELGTRHTISAQRNSNDQVSCADEKESPADRPLVGSSGVGILLNSEDLTGYKFDYIAVDGKPKMILISLKRLVGERGFEPPTPWSRNKGN
jgi:hypothetical protein